MQRTLQRSLILLSGLALAGCADTSVLGPGPSLAPNTPASLNYTPGEYDGSVPYYGSEAEFPFPKINWAIPQVRWEENVAVAQSQMNYNGNRAEEKFVLEVTGITPGSRTASSSSIGGYVVIWQYTHETPPFSLTVQASCGNIVNLTSQHIAKAVAFIDIKGFTSVSVDQPGGASRAQEDCREETRQETTGGGRSDCPECLQAPTSCWIYYKYDRATGAILYYHILYCE